MNLIQPPDLDRRFKKLFQSGKLVQVHVSKWSMTVTATASDFGLDKPLKEGEETPKIPDFLILGKKSLFTNDVRLVFSRIESSARTYLLSNSHRFPIADAHFVPMKALEKMLTELDKLRVKYMEQVDIFITNYEKYKQAMFDAYPDYVANLRPYYLSAEEARSKFDFSVSVYEVAFPKKVNKITMQDIVAQNLAAEKVADEYEALMKEQYQHHLSQMQEFVKESAKALRGEVVKTFEVIAQKIQNREVVSVSNLKTLRATIDSFDALDFLDDCKVKENLKTLKKLISSGADFKSDAEAVLRLSTAINTTLETAKSMTDIDALTGAYERRLDTDEEL
jgi:hypothetical protein